MAELVTFFSVLSFHFSKGTGHTKVSAKFSYIYEWNDLGFIIFSYFLPVLSHLPSILPDP